jgi:hypothetical protein
VPFGFAAVWPVPSALLWPAYTRNLLEFFGNFSLVFALHLRVADTCFLGSCVVLQNLLLTPLLRLIQYQMKLTRSTWRHSATMRKQA